jgi:hypothetical protein
VPCQELPPHSFRTIEVLLFHHPHFGMAFRDGDSSYDRVQAVVASDIWDTRPFELGAEHAQAGDVTHVERVEALHLC